MHIIYNFLFLLAGWVNAIQEVELESLTFRDFVTLLEFYDNKTIKPEDLILSDINQHHETTEDDVVSIVVKPVETVYFNQEGRISKTFYTKLYFTVDIKKPIIIQSRDELKINFNNWYSMFKYAKLHYISPNGKVYEDYVTREKTSSGDVPFEFDVKQKVDGESYYLSDILVFLL